MRIDMRSGRGNRQRVAVHQIQFVSPAKDLVKTDLGGAGASLTIDSLLDVFAVVPEVQTFPAAVREATASCRETYRLLSG
ncbi:MAG: hypothetical protein QOC89_3920 [Paraburkholderia sp.]|nr:hypothetical protein [Paraburkholderia sp.]